MKTKKEYPPKPQVPEKVYGIFTCALCGNKFEKSMLSDSGIEYHKKYGTATLKLYLRSNELCCYECHNKYSIEEMIRKLKEKRLKVISRR